MLDSRSFYGEYHGHRVQDLETLLREVRGERGVVFLAGLCRCMSSTSCQ